MKPIAMLTAAVALLAAAPALAQTDPDAAERREAMSKLAFMHGEWMGQAAGGNPDGSRYTVTQTERIGPFLDGDELVVEGRG